MAIRPRRRMGDNDDLMSDDLMPRSPMAPPSLEDQLTDQVMQTQPVGAPEALGPSPLLTRGRTGGVASPSDVAGGVSQSGGGSSLADNARRAAANNYTDIEGAGTLKPGAFMGGLEGFNTNAWGTGERGTNTHKNTFGKIASRYNPKQGGSTRALMADPDFSALFPDATLVDHPNEDLIDFDGAGPEPPVDVKRAATAGGAGEGWQWAPQNEGGDGGGGMLPTDDPMALAQQLGLGGELTSIEGLLGDGESDIQRIIAELMAQQQTPQV